MNGELGRYIAYLKGERNLAPYTVRNYRTDLLPFLLFLKQERIKALDEVDLPCLRHYLGQLLEEGYVRASIVRKVSVLRSFFRFLLREGRLSANPAAQLSTPKKEARLPTYLSQEEAFRLVELPFPQTPLGQRDRALLELFYACGVRVGEMEGLDLSEVNQEAREMKVLGKGSKERVVLLGEPAAAALHSYIEEGRRQLLKRRGEKALFLNRWGKRLSARMMQNLVRSYAEKAGIEKRVHPHLLRHTFATHLLDGDADLRVVQELLGHARLATTQIYTHVSQSQARRVYLSAHPRAAKEKSEDSSN